MPAVFQTIGRALLALTAVSLCSCNENAERGGDPSRPPDIVLELLTSSQALPHTTANEVVVVRGDMACLFESYAVRIWCGDREWEHTESFGREGRGPGELIDGKVVGSADSTIFFLDLRQGRLSRFSVSGDLLGMTPIDGFRRPLGRVQSDGWFGAHMLPVPGGGGQFRIVWTSTTRDSNYTQSLSVPPEAMAEDSIIQGGISTPTGELVLAVGFGRLAWFSREGQFMRVLEVPDLTQTTPTEEELSEKVVGRERFYRRIGQPAPPDLAEPFRDRLIGPRAWLPVNHTVAADPHGLVWMLSRRPAESGSYVEVFNRHTHLGSLLLSGEVKSITIADSLLVALVETPDTAGMAVKRLDWYRVRRQADQRNSTAIRDSA